MGRGLGFIFLIGIVAACLGAGRASPLDSSVEALKHEFAAHAKGPNPPPLRTKCDYFSEKTRADVPLDALLGVLEKPLPGTDARQGAFVKWQLLSALPASPDDATVERLLKIYQHAPLPSARYGSSAREKRELDKLIPGAQKQDDVKLTKRLEEAVTRGFDQDRPITAYRDELYARIPLGKQRFLAGMQDAQARLTVGGDKEALGERMAAELKEWASAPSADRTQVREVVEAFGKLRLVESPPYYKSAAVRRGRLQWVTETDTLLSKRRLTTLHKLLLDAAGTGALAPAVAGGGNGKH